MEAVTRTIIFTIIFTYSALSVAQPTIELIWSSTSGSGTPGSSEITADTGDYLTLEIFVTGDDEGLLSATIPLAWDAADLTAYNPEEVCALVPCSGGNGSNGVTVFVSPGGVTLGPGTARWFDVTGYDVLTNFPGVGYVNDTLLMGRIDFYVEASATTEDVVVDLSTSGGVTDGSLVSWQPAASATIRPPPGC